MSAFDEDYLLHTLRFLSHSSKALNNWFEVSPLWLTIVYPIVLIGLFSLLLGEKERRGNNSL